MATIELCPSRLSTLKAVLRRDYTEVKSSHLTEALACALGFRTHAALKANMKQYAAADAPFALLNRDYFLTKLVDLGYPEDIDPDFFFELYSDDGVIDTEPSSSYDIKYESQREKAWRNLMVSTINYGLSRKLFTLRPNDNRWPGVKEQPPGESSGYCFDFTLSNGMPVRGYVADASFDELLIHAAVNPKEGDWIKAYNAGFEAGDVFAAGWLERKTGAWLQSSTSSFNCRRHLLQYLSRLEVEPHGYGDKGRVIM